MGRVVAVVQVAQCLVTFPLFFFSFMYGGASAYPTAFAIGLLFFAIGFGSAGLLFFRAAAGAAVALLWHLTVLGIIAAALLRGAEASTPMLVLAAVSALLSAYLGTRAVRGPRRL
jgi:uncharacterized membrane protein